MLLGDKLNDILQHYAMSLTNKAENILKKLAEDEELIDYNNLFFKTGDRIIKSFNFLQRFGTLYDLLISLLNEEISIKEAKQGAKCDDKKS